MAKAKKIIVDEKEYILSFPSRQDAENAERVGFSFTALETQPLIQTGKLFYASLLAKQKNITDRIANDIREKFIEDGGDISEINEFLLEQYMGFFTSQNGKKKVKKAETIEI